MKKINKKQILIIGGIILAIILVGALFIIFTKNKDNEKDIKENDKVVATAKIEPLKNANAAEAADLIKANTVKIINKIDDETSVIGTGFFHESGYLVTNSHIVDIKGSISVEYPDGVTIDAQIYSNDITSDIALLKTSKPNVKAMSFGNTLTLNVTDDVYAVGYPYALEGEASVSKGILSARRTAGGIEFLQSDISLNTGNSGGPLINAKGELLGINTYATPNASIGMAISAEALETIINKLIKNADVNYLESDREPNALSVVLIEIGHHTDDIYNQKNIIDKYIHKKDKEDKKDNNDDNKQNNNQKPSPSEPVDTGGVVQSNPNADLSSLVIANYDIGFVKDKYQYQIVLKNQEDSLAITAIPLSSKATYEINGNSNFKTGTNTVTISVTAEKAVARHTYTITVVKPLDSIPRASGILSGLDVQYSASKNTNCFQFHTNFIDSDRVRVYLNDVLDANIFNGGTIKAYSGWNNDDHLDTSSLRLLKTYNLSNTEIVGRNFEIPLSDIRNLLTEDDYNNGVLYGDVDLTFVITINTKDKTFVEALPWGLKKQ